MVVGLTIVSFGTSMPELLVSVMASINGNTDIAIGNVVGSNIVNILLIVGIAAVIYPLRVQNNTVIAEIPFSVLAIVLVGFLANVSLETNGVDKALMISRFDGFILLFFFLFFMVYIFYISRGNSTDDEDAEPVKQIPISRAILLVLLGVAAMFFGGKWVVDGAVYMATQLGMSESLIGLTIVAVGTSLPELVTSAVAAWHKKSDIAIGNVVGSNIFNVFWILGLSAVISPLAFNPMNNFDLFATMAGTMSLVLFMVIGRKLKIGRLEGALLIAGYAAYIVFLIIRG